MQGRNSAADLRFTFHVSRFTVPGSDATTLLADFFSILLTAKGLFGRYKLTFDDCSDRGQSFRRGGFKT